MDKLMIYIHGQGGSPEEAQHYQPLLPEYDVIGFDYSARFPWEAKAEFAEFFDTAVRPYRSAAVIANSIGAFFAMQALSDSRLEAAYFISPVVDMEKLITDMMGWANVTEEELQEKGKIETGFGQTLSWKYLAYVREHPIRWQVPTHILYGSRDNLTSGQTIAGFSETIRAKLTVMEGGEHWFHTEEQMGFLDRWITAAVHSAR